MDDKEFISWLFGLKNVFKMVKLEVKAVNNARLNKNKTNSDNARIAGNNLYTQKHHDQKIHNDILFQYTKSIAYAPEDSEELALGYSNRSALLMHLHRYEECLTDINRALELTKSDQLKSKLEARKEKCLSLTSNKATEKGVGESMENLKVADEKTDRPLELPDMIHSAKIPCAAECVSIEKDEMYKRQLIANRDIKPGEIIISEKAYVCYPSNALIYLVCSHCLSFTWCGIPCDSCAYNIYCSEACKKGAWEEYHDIECSIMHSIFCYFYTLENDQSSSVSEDHGIKDMFLLARTFIKAVKTEGFQNIMNVTESIDNGTLDFFSSGSFKVNTFGYIYHLHAGPSKRNKSFRNNVEDAFVLYLLIKRTNLIPVAKKLKELNSADERIIIRLRDIFTKMQNITSLNSYTYQWYKCTHQNFFDCIDKCTSVKGAYFAPFSAIIKHSCVPNLARLSLPQPKIIVYASVPIKKGEQLCLSYGPTFDTDLAQRKLYLEKVMYYTCRCMACTDTQLFTRSINKEIFCLKYSKVTSKFKKIFGNNSMNFLLSQSDPSKWTIFTKTSFKQALKLIELYYKYFGYNEACKVTGHLHFYVRRAFQELYGEKFTVLNHC